jgi:hypothetical protein
LCDIITILNRVPPARASQTCARELAVIKRLPRDEGREVQAAAAETDQISLCAKSPDRAQPNTRIPSAEVTIEEGFSDRSYIVPPERHEQAGKIVACELK